MSENLGKSLSENCPKKISCCPPNTESASAQFRNFKISDSDWHLYSYSLAAAGRPSGMWRTRAIPPLTPEADGRHWPGERVPVVLCTGSLPVTVKAVHPSEVHFSQDH